MLAPRSPEFRVLLVDDDDSLRRALARSLRLAGLEVDEFHSAEELMTRGVPASGACLVLDVDMPGIDGIEFKKSLVASKRDLPTIFITALGAAEVGASLAALEPVAVLYKPFNKDALLQAVRRIGGNEKN